MSERSFYIFELLVFNGLYAFCNAAVNVTLKCSFTCIKKRDMAFLMYIYIVQVACILASNILILIHELS